MPSNEKKIISIIREQCSGIEERCDGYREEIIKVISDILQYERNHRISATRIQKKINEKFSSTARFLAKKRGHDTDMEKPDT